jgi:hypothetical protein
MVFRLLRAWSSSDGSLVRALLIALLLALMSLSGVNAALTILHGASRPQPEASSGLIRSVATHAADSGDQ